MQWYESQESASGHICLFRVKKNDYLTHNITSQQCSIFYFTLLLGIGLVFDIHGCSLARGGRGKKKFKNEITARWGSCLSWEVWNVKGKALESCVPAHPGEVSLEQSSWHEARWPVLCWSLEQMVQMVPPGPAICASAGEKTCFTNRQSSRTSSCRGVYISLE